jgi:aryl-alcohol dehydrogenase-like predicted oxidoreductase
MRTYFAAGITTFDCADIYTGVEALIGEFRRSLSASEQSIFRVHTKVVPDLASLPTLEYAGIERIVNRSRARLGVDALDLAQLHWWDYRIPGYVAAASHLERLHSLGLIRHVGATNFSTATLREMLDRGIPIVAHQLQYSLLDRRAEASMLRLCAERGVRVLCYGALAGGFLTRRWLGAAEPQEPLENRSLTKYKLIIDDFGGWALFQELLHVLVAIAERHGVEVGTIVLRWTLDRPGVHSVIVGARNAEHLYTTLRVRTLALDDADRGAIAAVLARSRGPAGDVYDIERDRAGRHGRIMRYDLGGP